MFVFVHCSLTGSTIDATEHLCILLWSQVHNIVDKACKELAMEKMIKDLEVSWKTLEFDHETHKV